MTSISYLVNIGAEVIAEGNADLVAGLEAQGRPGQLAVIQPRVERHPWALEPPRVNT